MKSQNGISSSGGHVLARQPHLDGFFLEIPLQLQFRLSDTHFVSSFDQQMQSSLAWREYLLRWIDENTTRNNRDSGSLVDIVQSIAIGHFLPRLLIKREREQENKREREKGLVRTIEQQTNKEFSYLDRIIVDIQFFEEIIAAFLGELRGDHHRSLQSDSRVDHSGWW
jgi:hypothetical protein